VIVRISTIALLASITILISRTDPMFTQVSDDMVFVKGGTFTMGSSSSETLMHDARNKPAHEMTVSDFYISKYEVTQEEFESITGNNPSRYKGLNRPVETVSWFDAVRFCNALSEKEGLTPCYHIDGSEVEYDVRANGYRLPTEAEWEYAARGGHLSNDDYLFAGSNELSEIA
jgi:formylglycine-generating enzyme required for sulfatase activity